MELDHHEDTLECKKCSKGDQFVSHGFVYKKHTKGQQRTVGKRIFCSNRHGKTGCGCTYRLYLAVELPSLQYTTEHLFVFLTALLAGLGIQKAYTKATNALDPRNAYRWLCKLERKLIEHRAFVATRTQPGLLAFITRCRRLQILLPTIQRIFSKTDRQPCLQYQLRQQSAFI